MVIWFYGRCWCMAGLTPRFSTLWIIVVYPLFISSHDTVQKIFSFLLLSSSLHVTKRHVLKQLIHQLVMFFQVLQAPDIGLHRVSSSNSLSSNFCGAPERSLSSSSKSLFLKRRNQSLHVVSDRALSP